jgi:predicted nucleic acid-binding protein
VTVVIDAAPLVTLADRDDPRRSAVLEAMRDEPGDLIVPAPTTAEVDYLLGERYGRPARRAFLRDLAEGRYAVVCLEREDYAAIQNVDDRYADLELGLSDCAIVLLAHRYDTTRIISFDERHFRAVTPLQGGAFTILPTDEG